VVVVGDRRTSASRHVWRLAAQGGEREGSKEGAPLVENAAFIARPSDRGQSIVFLDADAPLADLAGVG
jgi:hypothetical protein